MACTSSITMRSLVAGNSHAAGGGGAKSSAFVCFLSVTLWNGRVCANNFVIKALEYRNGFGTLDRGKFVIVHLHSTLALHLYVVPSQNVEIGNTAKFVIFSHVKGDTHD